MLTILLSLLVVALVAGLAIPAWFSRHEVTLDNAALLLARDLHATQGRASQLGVSTRLELGPDGWRALDEEGSPLERAGEERIERRLSADAVFEGVSLAAISFGPDRAMSFGPAGQALEGGSVVLRFRGHERRLAVEPASGRVTIDGLAREWSDAGR